MANFLIFGLNMSFHYRNISKTLSSGYYYLYRLIHKKRHKESSNGRILYTLSHVTHHVCVHVHTYVYLGIISDNQIMINIHDSSLLKK